MVVSKGPRPLLILIALVAPTESFRPAFAQSLPLEASRSYAWFIPLNLDGGLALNLDGARSRFLGAASAGVGIFNGSHVWECTAGLRDIFQDHREMAVALARSGVENGLGFHAEGLWGIAAAAAGAGAGLSFSIVNVEGSVLFDPHRTKYLSLFLRVPVGLMIHAATTRAL
jgi:hypothetical protein